MSKFEYPIADHDLEQLTTLFRILGDKIRLQILLMLEKDELNVGSIREILDLPQPTVSHHLGVLRGSCLINARRHGKQVYYTLNGSVSIDKVAVIDLDVQNYLVRVFHKESDAKDVQATVGKDCNHRDVDNGCRARKRKPRIGKAM